METTKHKFLLWFVQFKCKYPADTGSYVCQHGIAAACRSYSRKFQHSVNESTVWYTKKGYLKGSREKRTAEDEAHDLHVMPPKKREKPILLGEDIQRKVQLYRGKVRGRGAVSGKIVVVVARGILMDMPGWDWWRYTIVQVLGILTFGLHEVRSEQGYHCQV